MSVVNSTAKTTVTSEDYGCMSQIHDDTGRVVYKTNTHCWQVRKSCDELQITNVTSSFDFEEFSYPGLEFCSDGIVVHTFQEHADNSPASILALPSVQSKILTPLTGNQTANLTCDRLARGNVTESDMANSSYTIEYIAAKGLGPVLAGVAALLTQQAPFANTSEKLTGTVYTTEAFVAVDWHWLIYPATLVLGGTALLVSTALNSHRCGLKIWKSSMLPLLYRTLDPDLLAKQAVLHDVSTMTGVAGKAKVMLVETTREDGVVLTH